MRQFLFGPSISARRPARHHRRRDCLNRHLRDPAMGDRRVARLGLLAFGVATAVGVFFGWYPAKQASRLDPIVALRRE
jgi:hypothetical protein